MKQPDRAARSPIDAESRQSFRLQKFLLRLRVAHRDSYKILPRLQILAVIGCLFILMYGCAFRDSVDFARIVGVGVLMAGASLAAGFLLGFVFAIPRDGNEAAGTTPAANSSRSQTGDAKEKISSIRPNSNLVEISDWLTKIIVGVGLVELKSLLVHLGAFSYSLGLGMLPAKVDPHDPRSIMPGQSAALAIIVFYAAVGFMIGYVWTRLHFARDLERQIRELEEQNESLEQDKLKLEQQKENLEQYRLILTVEQMVKEGQLDEAMQYIDQAIQKHPEDGRMIMTKARILKRQATLPGVTEDRKNQLLNQALASTNRAIALLPGKPEPIYNKACYLAILGTEEHRKEIFAGLEAAFQMNPGLKRIAAYDLDLKDLRTDDEFNRLIREDVEPDH